MQPAFNQEMMPPNDHELDDHVREHNASYTRYKTLCEMNPLAAVVSIDGVGAFDHFSRA